MVFHHVPANIRARYNCLFLTPNFKAMLELKEKYLVDSNNNPIAVQLDIETFKRLEEVLEDHALAQYMNESADDEKLNLKEAKAYYKKINK